MVTNEVLSLIDSMRNQGMTWAAIVPAVNDQTGLHYGSTSYRKAYYAWKGLNPPAAEKTEEATEDENEAEELLAMIASVKMEKNKLSDYRAEVNRMYKRMSREETIKEIAHDAAVEMAAKNPFPIIKPRIKANGDCRAGVLVASDWHMGSVQNNAYNKFDSGICVRRVYDLMTAADDMLEKFLEPGDSLTIVNLGDLINGIIHSQIRINNQIDVITQIINVSELMAVLVHHFAEKYTVTYVSTLDNHSRIFPDKKESVDLESLCRITDWYVAKRCANDGVNFTLNIYGDDIATFSVLDKWNVAAVHGHKDTPNQVIENLTNYTRQPYDIVITAHRHHFAAEERTGCMMISNGSLMGTDDFAISQRLCSKPSQTLIISSQENPVEFICPLTLEDKFYRYE